ncbi:cysteine desulfurase, mitochondrial isoform X1 [Terrapene carolina triunguis]|uniref:cysteine desulfurase, mitochondrial isoform X1 n=1 Tax=Terrapene triunguis TaxID=2587831 RepID=UPI000CEF7999|nr:cysteine desulfurase, mitochondrial isoform X1 [Terrapene carolina triunguis]XP_024065703.1 cysteine desulfurase, mitochondrial isoform X1 [Terrapene carolina triunguis]
MLPAPLGWLKRPLVRMQGVSLPPILAVQVVTGSPLECPVWCMFSLERFHAHYGSPDFFSCTTVCSCCWKVLPFSSPSHCVLTCPLCLLGSYHCSVYIFSSLEKGLGEESTLRPLYMDVQATTPLDPRVLDSMLPYLMHYYGNPHSRTHAYGWESESAMERARQQVASLIGADPREIIFTSGATESNNLAIKGVARFYKSRKKHIITTQTEHKCVLDSCRYLEAEGFRVTYLPVKRNGLIDLKELEDALQPDTSLVSIMTVNNEIGVKQPISDIGQICSSRKVFFHTDAAQAVGKIPMDVNDMKIDLMSISGHKIYGPKGVGAIYIRRRPRVRLEPLQSGGGQERGMRSGTVPTPLAVGLGAACEVSQQEMEYDYKRISVLADRLVTKIMTEIPDVVMNGDPEHHYPGCINLSFAYVEGESLLMALKDVALSSGSACTSASLEPSYVLRAIGTDEDLAHSSIRFGIGRFTTEEEVDYTVQKCIQHVKRLREMSPLWEMVQDGVDLKSIKWTQH